MTLFSIMQYYAVARGKECRVVNTWAECKALTDGYKSAIYKKFSTLADAERFIADHAPAPEPEPKKTITSVSAVIDFEPDYWVYTDGACVGNGSASAKAGIGIFFGPHDPRNVSKLVEGKQSNNTAELGAINTLYEIIQDDIKAGKKIAVASDSNYAIRCVTSYGQACDSNGWKKDIPNKDLVKHTYELYKDHPNVRFFYVKAHTDEKDPHSVGNDAADKLANLAVGVESCPYAGAPVFLNVPFSRKEEVKALGGRWDPTVKKWYVSSNAHNLKAVLERFLPT